MELQREGALGEEVSLEDEDHLKKVRSSVVEACRSLKLNVVEMDVDSGPPLQVFLSFEGTTPLIPRTPVIEERVRGKLGSIEHLDLNGFMMILDDRTPR